MKIGIFTDSYEPYISGVVSSVNMLASGLIKMGHTVYIVCPNLVTNKMYFDNKKNVLYIPGLRTNICDLKLANPFIKKASKIIESWNLDVIHSQTEFGIGILSRKIAKKNNIPIVHTYHTLYYDYVHYILGGHLKKLTLYSIDKFTKYFCEKKCDELIVPTDKIKELFLNDYSYKKDINVIPSGIDIDHYASYDKKLLSNLKKEYGIKEKDFVVGSIGRIAEEKSYDRFLKASVPLLKKYSNLKLVLVGDGPNLENLKNLTKELEIENRVIFTGKAVFDVVNTYYHLLDIMITFSTTETQGLTIIEALSAGIPIVSIDDDSFKDTLTDNYNSLIFFNDSEYQKNISRLIDDKKLYKKLKANARDSVDKYSNIAFAKKVYEVYKKAIAKKQK